MVGKRLLRNDVETLLVIGARCSYSTISFLLALEDRSYLIIHVCIKVEHDRPIKSSILSQNLSCNNELVTFDNDLKYLFLLNFLSETSTVLQGD